MRNISIWWIIIILLGCCSCSKDFLGKKPDKALIIPQTFDDFTKLLDNVRVMNITPGLGVLGSDDYYLTEDAWQSLYTSTEKNAYIWAQDVYEGENAPDWNIPYQQIFYTNVVLEGLNKIKRDSTNRVTWDLMEGNALFYRAFAFYNLATLFAAAYDPVTASKDPGIPIRLSADINERVIRGTVRQTYERIIQDTRMAVPLLPISPDYKTHGSKAAAYALLARACMDMQQYGKARLYADSCIQTAGVLMDYNKLDSTSNHPFPPFNEEVIFESEMVSYGAFYSSATSVDSVLYHSYDSTDLRKSLFFKIGRKGYVNFNGYYSGVYNLFGGIALDEVYLIRAECYARQQKTGPALNDLNTLLEKRYRVNSFTRLAGLSPEETLNRILLERRKELAFRGLRWTDLRRLNKIDKSPVTLTRLLNGQVYMLLPNDPKYTWPIPDDEIQGSGIKQNPRK